jgi:hypothetical protein
MMHGGMVVVVAKAKGQKVGKVLEVSAALATPGMEGTYHGGNVKEAMIDKCLRLLFGV